MPSSSHRREELIVSATELYFGTEVFRPLNDTEALEVASRIRESFGDAANGAMTGWWRVTGASPVPSASRCFREGGWRHLVAVSPEPPDRIWLLAEDMWYQPVRFVAFESTAKVAQQVLGNATGFEYIVSGFRYDWLFAEDHHDCVAVAGAEAIKRLMRIQPSE